MGECLIFVKQIKQSQADVTEFWKRVEQGEKEREGKMMRKSWRRKSKVKSRRKEGSQRNTRKGRKRWKGEGVRRKRRKEKETS